MTTPFKSRRQDARWSPPRPKWKNRFCGMCRIWIDSERITQHEGTPLHRSELKLRQAAI